MVTSRAETERTSGTLRLRTYTCLGCGHRSASWDAFRAHRRRCKGSAPLEASPAGGSAAGGDEEESGAAAPEALD
jgi:hypothetical protein